MKRLICLILALLLLAPAAYADVSELPTLKLNLSASATKVGDTVRVTVSVDNAPTCASYHIIYSYDTAVLKPVKGDKLETGGLFTTNLNPKEKGTISTIAADAKKVLEGKRNLFYTDFEVIAAPAEGTNTPLTVTYQEFYTPELERLVNVQINSCTIPIIDPNAKDEPAPAPDGETPKDETPKEETPKDEAPKDEAPKEEAPKEEPKEETPMDNLPPQSDWEAPTGKWEIDEEKNQATLVTPDGKNETYTYEEQVDEETGESNLILFDQDGNMAGGLQINKGEDEKITVLQQTFDVLDTDKFSKNDSTLLYYLIPICAAAAIGAVLLVIGLRKSKKAGAKK